MPDSETTKKQKRDEFALLTECVDYLQTHGLDCIGYADLRSVTRALDRSIDYGVR